MIELLGTTQQQLLKLLNKHKDGLTIAELIAMLDISRNAVKQHISVLEKSELITTGLLHKTAGRPTQSYVLTDKGREYFPRKYSWLAGLLMEQIREEKDERGLQKFLDKLGTNISSQYIPHLKKLSLPERLKATASILSELGYEAEVLPGKNKNELRLEVTNCVFQNLVSTCPEICSFDKSLVKSLTGQKLEQQSCIAQGENACCFGVKK